MTIPIRNLYYLFCYAWAHFPEGEAVDVGVDECPDLKNLFARILINGANRLMRRGLDRGYFSRTEETRSPRGRMLIDEVVKQQTLRRGAVICAFDELTPDVLHNQILKATARSLSRVDGLEKTYRHELGLIVRRMDAVSDLRITSQCFQRVQLSRNTGQYRPLLKLCELVHRSLLPEQNGAASRFADLLEDEVTMSTVFEEFLRNFYAHEQRVFRVGRETMAWDGESADPADWALLPTMNTDITLRSPQRTIVIDAKFWKDPLALNQYGGRKHHASNLYQLYAYMRHTRLKTPHLPVDGALIYAATSEPFATKYRLGEHQVQIVAIDLTGQWKGIYDKLREVVLGPDAAAKAA